MRARSPIAPRRLHIVCPHCAQKYWHDGTPDGGASKYDLNKSGRWVPDGMSIDKDGNLIGEPLSKSRIPSFWLTGVAAAWQRWDRMVEALLTAQQKFEETGDDGELKTSLTPISACLTSRPA